MGFAGEHNEGNNQQHMVLHVPTYADPSNPRTSVSVPLRRSSSSPSLLSSSSLASSPPSQFFNFQSIIPTSGFRLTRPKIFLTVTMLLLATLGVSIFSLLKLQQAISKASNMSLPDGQSCYEANGKWQGCSDFTNSGNSNLPQSCYDACNTIGRYVIGTAVSSAAAVATLVILTCCLIRDCRHSYENNNYRSLSPHR